MPTSQSQWDPIVADYVLFKANTNAYDLIFTDTIIFQLIADAYNNYGVMDGHGSMPIRMSILLNDNNNTKYLHFQWIMFRNLKWNLKCIEIVRR